MPRATFRVTAGADDGYLRGSTGQFSAGTTFVIVNHISDAAGFDHASFIRLVIDAGDELPNRSDIQAARLVLTPSAGASSTHSSYVSLDTAVNPTAPTTAATFNAKVRGTKKLFRPPGWNRDVETALDIADLVQTQVNRPGYNSHPLQVLWDFFAAYVSGGPNNNYQAYSWNADPAKAVRLEVDYTPPALTGTGSVAAPGGQASGTGTASNPAATGEGSAAAPEATASGTGASDSPGVTAAGSSTAPGATASGTGATENPDVTATGTSEAPGETATGEGTSQSEPPYIAEGQDYAPEGAFSGVAESRSPEFTADGLAAAPEQVFVGTGRSSPPPPLPEGTLLASPQSELANAIARHMLSLLPPGRKPKEGGRAFYTVVAFSALLADADEAVIQMIRDWSPSQTQRPDLLALVGTARGVKRGVGEPFEAYRARVVNARDFWRLGGTVPGVVRALETAGYKVKVAELYKVDRTRWAEFSLELYPDRTEFTADAWNDGQGYWNDGTPWDWGISTTEKGRILGIIGEMKAAHSKVASITYQHGGPQDFWDDGAGGWEDDTIWHGFAPVQIL